MSYLLVFVLVLGVQVTKTGSLIPIEKLVANIHARDTNVLTDEQVQMWRDTGALLIDNIFPPELITRAVSEVNKAWPLEENLGKQYRGPYFWYDEMRFPSKYQAVNELGMHPRMIRAAEQLLGVNSSEIRLSMHRTWPKFGAEHPEDSQSSSDQRIHTDFLFHSLVGPNEWDAHDNVQMIVYLSDDSETGGQTRVVLRKGRNDEAYNLTANYFLNDVGVGNIPFINDRITAEKYIAEHHPNVSQFRSKLYERERPVSFTFGTVLFFRCDNWHRGTPVLPGRGRYTTNLVFKRARRDWVLRCQESWTSVAGASDKRLHKIIGKGGVDVRNVLGIPPPRDSFWSERTLNAFATRYAPFGFDATPYWDALAENERKGDDKCEAS